MINKTILIGRIGKDAEHSSLGDTNIIKFTLATSETYLDKQGNKVEQTEWHNISYFSKSIKIAEHLTKGTLVYIEGKIKSSKVEKDGEVKYFYGIVAQNIKLLSKAEQREINSSTSQQSDEDVDDDLPF